MIYRKLEAFAASGAPSVCSPSVLVSCVHIRSITFVITWCGSLIIIRPSSRAGADEVMSNLPTSFSCGNLCLIAYADFPASLNESCPRSPGKISSTWPNGWTLAERARSTTSRLDEKRAFSAYMEALCGRISVVSPSCRKPEASAHNFRGPCQQTSLQAEPMRFWV